MKRYRITSIIPIAVLAALVIPGRLPAQQHHHYRLIDLGTFGGPNSYFNTLLVTDGFNYGTVFYGNAQVRNGQGTFVGFADTSIPDPSPGPPFCYVPECFVAHAFEWREGNLIDLGTLPDGASGAAFWINSNGLIVGNSENGEFDPVIPGVPELRAVIWRNGKIRDLGILGGSTSFAQAVNDLGQVTGLALNGIPDPFSFYYQYLYCLPLQICPVNATETRAVSSNTVLHDLRLAEAWLDEQMRCSRCFLTPKRWAQIEELFHRAAECDSIQRTSLLEFMHVHVTRPCRILADFKASQTFGEGQVRR